MLRRFQAGATAVQDFGHDGRNRAGDSQDRGREWHGSPDPGNLDRMLVRSWTAFHGSGDPCHLQNGAVLPRPNEPSLPVRFYAVVFNSPCPNPSTISLPVPVAASAATCSSSWARTTTSRRNLWSSTPESVAWINRAMAPAWRLMPRRSFAPSTSDDPRFVAISSAANPFAAARCWAAGVRWLRPDRSRPRAPERSFRLRSRTPSAS